MKAILARHGYIFDEDKGIWHRQDFDGIAYSDGDEVENRLFDIISNAKDLSVLSDELKPHCTDWPSLYHLSSSRANILRPFEEDLSGDILEIGGGCGAITRYLGECGGNVLALEGTPRRAMIARSRTRDLKNVTVLNEKFENFNIDQQFDVITLIGVLEYANLFTSSETPAITMLEMVRKLLKPDGKLIIAIENQLGLKYFAGAPEDHIGQAMYGIEGRYTKNQPQTYGRKVLNDMLSSTGFEAVDFLAPFPDYKLPVSIVTEEGFNDDHFDASAFAIQSVKKDPQLPNEVLFCQELVWHSLHANKLVLDHSNSFLICAGLNTSLKDKKNKPSILAWHFSVNRRSFFCKQAIFKNDKKNNLLNVFYKKLYNSEIENSGLLKQKFKFESPYFYGFPLSYQLSAIVSKDDWTFEEIGVFLEKYISTLKNIFKLKFDEIGNSQLLLPGELIDAIPQNIIFDNNGTYQYFDDEWVWLEQIPLGYLVFRSLMLLTKSHSKFARNNQFLNLNIYEFIKLSFEKIGFEFTDEIITHYVKIESQLYLESGGSSFSVNAFIEDMKKTFLLNSRELNASNAYEAEIARLSINVHDKEAELEALYYSFSWRITKFIRIIGSVKKNFLQSKFLSNLRSVFRLTSSAIKLAIVGEWRKLFSKLLAYCIARYKNIPYYTNKGIKSVGIMTTPHTIFISNLLVKNLEDCGLDVSVFISECPKKFDLDTYFVICPQMFNSLPPGEKRICFQMEQSVSSRWFTDEYLSILGNSAAVFDYSFDNLKFLNSKGISYPLTYFLPIGGYVDYLSYLKLNKSPNTSKVCDILFYGDTNTSRRKDMLDYLRSRFNVRVVNNMFGDDLCNEILNARCVINLHYYDGALLETTRIYECLSLGIPVVSEDSSDIASHQLLNDAVEFFPSGNKEAMVSAVEKVLKQRHDLIENKIKIIVEETSVYFSFMFYRALYSLKMISHQQWDILNKQFKIPSNCLALSLPETVHRRESYLSVQPENAILFDGLRYSPGWIGCALSYKYLANRALAGNLKQLEVMEDDVIFDDKYDERRSVVNQWLDDNFGEWDVFAGIIADIHKDTKILKVEKFKGVTFVTINRMTSTVHNIYSRKLLKILSDWDPDYVDPVKNTIDRYIQSRMDIKVVVTLPFLVGHREDVDSSLWGFNNSQYNNWISRSEEKLNELISKFYI